MNNRQFLLSIVAGVVSLSVTHVATGADEVSAEQPNIIYVMADDLGYGDLGCYGSSLNATPNIDRMAAQGIKFTDFNACASCGPSRCSLMTGCHPNRSGLRGKLADRITIAEMLKAQGYATALIGKWHLGMDEGTHPMDQGFDYWYGTKGSNDWDGPPPNYGPFKNAPESAWKTPVYRNREEQGICPQSQFTQRYTEETINLINKHKGKPFFIYLAHNMPHVPVFPSEQFQGKSSNGVFGDVLLELDWSMGEILKALKKAGVKKKTLVIFTSDNGPWTMFKEFGGTAAPLRGQKSTTWEGGFRVPTIAYWPDTIKPATSSAFIVNSDIYATVAKFVGATVEEDQAIDSHDMSDVFLSGAKSTRTKYIYHCREPMAYRSGDYKLHFLSRNRSRDPETGTRELPILHDPPLLFNIGEDITESKNIAPEHPDIVERLTDEYEKAKEALKNWEKYD